MRANQKWGITGLLLLALAGCGGGGSSGPDATSAAGGTGGTADAGSQTPATPAPPPPASASPAMGVWYAASSNGYDMRFAISSSGEFFGIYTSGEVPFGIFNGRTTVNGSTISGDIREYLISSRSSLDSDFSGPWVPKKSILANFSRGGKLDALYLPAFERSAAISRIAGNYSGTGETQFRTPGPMSFTVSSNGQFTMRQQVCSASGTLAPHVNSHDLYDVRLTYTGADCVRNGVGLTGLAHYDEMSRRMVIVALMGTRSDGAYFIGRKS